MDPYLEHPSHFPNFHDKLIVHLEEFLQPLLPEGYYAKAANRVWLEYTEEVRVPDVSVLRPNRPVVSAERERGDVAIIDAPVKITAPYLPWSEHHESYVEIYSKHEGDARLITSIEVLSPSNKASGEQARGAYGEKQAEILAANVNLVEIDLLRCGLHTTAVPRNQLLERCGKVDYHVCVHRFDQLHDFFVYPVQLPERLPKISIPLTISTADVQVDLQALLDFCYDRGPYRRAIDYAKDPPPPALSPERLAWVKSRLESPKNIHL